MGKENNMRFYLSHSIRGKYGKDATPTQMKENCDKIIQICKLIKKILPPVDLYVPAEHEDFVGIAYKEKYLTEQQILAIDCKIIDRCDGILIYCPPDDPIQGGRQIEYDHAVATNKPVCVFSEVIQAVVWLTYQITRA